MRGWWAMLVALAAAAVLAIVATTPPAPLPADAPPGAFSAMRAMRDVRAIARAPHPTGSAENARVRGYLIGRMQALGMDAAAMPSPLDAKGKKVLDRWRGTPAPAPVVTSVLGTLPGRDRTKPAVLLMAHFDSVWGSPGAADDASGVAAALEVVRAVRAGGGAPARDLMVLLTDGEELGLEGARAFFATNPARARVGTVINMESRGGGGRAAMFETGRGNADAMRLFSQAVGGPVATSLSVFIYERLPNSTDFTPAKRAGWQGYNFAFIGRPAYYHSPLSTPEIVDTGAVQDMGGQVLDLTHALLAAPSLPRASGDRTFFDAYGLWLVGYPPAFGWVLLLAGIAGYAVSARRDVAAASRGAGAAIVLAVVAGALLVALNLLSGADGPVNYYDRLAAIPRLQIQALLACGAALAVTAGLFLRGRATPGFVAGRALPVAALAIAAQVAAPTASYVLAVPLLLGGLAAAVRWRAAAVAAAALVTGYLLGFAFFLMQAVGPKTPVIAILPLLLTALVLAPLAGRIARRPAVILAAILLTLGAGVALSVRLDPQARSVPPYSNDK